jgi:hypothetical protein
MAFALVDEYCDENDKMQTEIHSVYQTLDSALKMYFVYARNDFSYTIQEVELPWTPCSLLRPRVMYAVVEGSVLRYTRLRCEPACVTFRGTLKQFRSHKYLLRKNANNEMTPYFEFDHTFCVKARPGGPFWLYYGRKSPYITAKEASDPDASPVVNACILSNEPTLQL